MPDSNETPAFNLDELKFLPAWMKEEPAGPPKYREYRDEPEPRRGDGDRPRGPRNDRDRDRLSGAPRRAPAGGGSSSFGQRGPRPGGSDDRRRDGGRPGDRNRPGGGRDRHDERGRDDRPSAPTPVQPAAVRVDFLPDPRGLASIAKQIRASHLAYPLFGMARMFLSRPERHRVRFSVENPTASATPRTPVEAGPPAHANGNGNGSNRPPAHALAPVRELFQLGENGLVATDKAALEKIAFDRHRDQYYVAVTMQKDPPKGNFTNVARERLSGTLLGPTNHHAYQTNLRALYDSRFSRRMSFEQYRRGIEVVSDPALVERWKEETRTTTVYTLRPPDAPAAEPAPVTEAADTAASAPVAGNGESPEVAPAETPQTGDAAEVSAAPAAEVGAETPGSTESEAAAAAEPAGPPPIVFQSLAEVRQHFREHYFDALVRRGRSFEMPGEVARNLPEPGLMLALRLAHDREIKYPGGLVQPLRGGLQNTGLHVFKHRKRVVFVSIARPTPFEGGDSAVSENVTAILDAVTQHPLCTRKALADHVLARRFGKQAMGAFSVAPVAPVEAVEAPAPDASAPAEVPVAEPAAAALTEPAPAPPDDALAKAKAGLAADLRYLVQAGHIIEFHNGTFDLPLAPKPRETPAPAPAAKPSGNDKAGPADTLPAGGTAAPSEPVAPVAAAEAAPTDPTNLPEGGNIQPDEHAVSEPAPAEADAPLPVWEEPPMDPDAEETPLHSRPETPGSDRPASEEPPRPPAS